MAKRRTETNFWGYLLFFIDLPLGLLWVYGLLTRRPITGWFVVAGLILFGSLVFVYWRPGESKEKGSAIRPTWWVNEADAA